jgi:hypothetical protein
MKPSGTRLKIATTVARRITEAYGIRPRGKAIRVALGATGAWLPDASNLLSCSKADAFTR